MPRINNGWMLSPRQDKYTIPSKPLGTRAGTLRKRLQENARGLLYDTNKISEQLWWSSAFSMHETGPVHSQPWVGEGEVHGAWLSWLFYCPDEQHAKELPGEERAHLAYASTVHLWRKIGQELKKDRNLVVGTDEEAMKEYCSLACCPINSKKKVK